jgi:hypothetical protein
MKYIHTVGIRTNNKLQEKYRLLETGIFLKKRGDRLRETTNSVSTARMKGKKIKTTFIRLLPIISRREFARKALFNGTLNCSIS